MTGPTRRELAPPVDLPALVARGARLLRSLGGSFAVSEAQAARAAAEWKGETRPLRIGGVSLRTEDASIDLVDRRVELRALFEEAIEATVQGGFVVRAGTEEVPVVPMEYLAAMKMASPRGQDEVDLEFLLRQPGLDYALAREIVRRHLGFVVARLLDRMAHRVGRTDARRDYEDDG